LEHSRTIPLTDIGAPKSRKPTAPRAGLKVRPKHISRCLKE
jgi:hypothetical protein